MNIEKCLIRSPRRRLVASAAFLLAWALVSPTSRGLGQQPAVSDAQTADEQTETRFAAGLRARKLFQLAEQSCRDRLQTKGISERHRADITIELLRTLADQAMHSEPEKRPPVWEKARQAADHFQQRHAKNPWLFLVLSQDALTSLAHGELARQEFEVSANTKRLETARQHLRKASLSISSLDDQLKRAIPKAQGVRATEQLTAEQLLSIRNNMLYQLGRTYRNQAQCYKPRSADQINSLTRAIEKLEQPLTQLAATDELRQLILLELGVCHRLMGQLAKSHRTLISIDALRPRPAIALRQRAELIRLNLVANRLGEARKQLSEPREIDGVKSAHLDFAYLEVVLSLLAKADAAKMDDDAKIWRDRAVNMVRFVEDTHGAYWARRANALLVKVAGAGKAVGNLDILRRTANEYYLKGEMPAALKAYDEAARFAASIGMKSEAFSIRCTAAEVERKQKKMPECIRRLREACRELRDVTNAPAMHMAASIEALRLSTDDSQWLDVYEEMLAEHIKLWPMSPTANHARARLASRLQALGHYGAALSIYRKVTVDYERFGSVVRATEECTRGQLGRLGRGTSQYEAGVKNAIEHFDRLVLGSEQRPPERWTPGVRLAVTAAARLRIENRPGELTKARDILLAALQGQPTPSKTWISTARSLLIVVYAKQGNTVAASRMADKLAAASTRDLLATLQGLSQLSESGDERTVRQVAALQVTLAERVLKDQQLQPITRIAVRRLRAASLSHTAKHAEALDEFKKLVEERPRDLAIQRGFARALGAAGTKSSLTTAAQRWRLIKRLTKPGSESWFESHYALAQTYFDLGDKKRAAQIIRLLMATTDISKSTYHERLMRLLRMCEA